jgi:hypoxanthine phosphoribosyltransferase
VLKGAFIFLADLSRAIPLPHALDFVVLAGYDGALGGRTKIRLIKDLDLPVTGRDILLVENVIDTGLTLNYLVRYLRGKKPGSLRICTLLDKPARRLVEIDVDYTGFTIPDQFVVGYGLDYGELYRNLRYVGVLKPEVYSEVDGG